MGEEDLRFTISIMFSIYVIGAVSISFLLLTFFSSKVLRGHPSTLIMCCCITELAFAYSMIIVYWQAFTVLDIQGFDTFYFTYDIFHTCTFGLIKMTDNGIEYLLTIMLWFPLFMTHIYYICLSIDIVLLIRNPFYPPERRAKKYHMAAFLIPTIIAIISIYIYNLI